MKQTERVKAMFTRLRPRLATHALTRGCASKPALPAPIPSLATETFDWRDPLSLSAGLTDDEIAMYDAARSFAQKASSRPPPPSSHSALPLPCDLPPDIRRSSCPA